MVSHQGALKFVLIAGGPQGGKSTLFTRLVGAPHDYAQQLGGGPATAAAAAVMGGTSGDLGGGTGGTAGSAAGGTAGAGQGMEMGGGGVGGVGWRAKAVDIQPLRGGAVSNSHVVVFPGLRSADVGTAQLSQQLAEALAGEKVVEGGEG